MKRLERWWIVGVALGALVLSGNMSVQAQNLEERVQKLEKEIGDGLPAWLDKFKFSGDLRLRYQHDDRDGESERDRGRYRARLNVTAQVVEQIKVIIGLASGSDDPRSTNETFDDSFSSKGVNIDLAYAEYTPVKWAEILGGKMKNPLWTPSDLLWDSDIRPEGGAGGLTYKLMPDMTVFFTVAGFVLDEDSGGSDPFMIPVQGGIEAKLANRFDVKLALTYYEFIDVQNHVLDFSAESNTLTPDGVLQFDYNVFSVSGEVGFDLKLLGNLIPYVTVFGDYVVNFDPNDDDQGYLVGIEVGHKKISTPGQWQFTYQYRRLERDAWLDILPDSDFFGGATNAEGHEIIAVVGVYKNVSLGIDYYHTEEIEGDTEEDVFQFDVSFSF
jgi:hypothetical protein